MLFAMPISVNAAEIDLTSFASGSSLTHSHVYTQKYDSQSHWSECTLCDDRINVGQHVLSSRHTNPEKPCSTSSLILTSCSQCAYTSSSNATEQVEHVYTPYQVVTDLYQSSYDILAMCNVCGYVRSDFQYYYEDGSMVDLRDFTLPCTVYLANGSMKTFTSTQVSHIFGSKPNSNVEVTVSEDKSTLTVYGEVFLTDDCYTLYKNSKAAGLLLDNWYSNSVLYYCHGNKPDAGYYIWPSCTFYEDEKKVVISGSFPLCDMTRDCTGIPFVHLNILFRDYANSGKTVVRDLYPYYTSLQLRDLLYREPSIDSLSCN